MLYDCVVIYLKHAIDTSPHNHLQRFYAICLRSHDFHPYCCDDGDHWPHPLIELNGSKYSWNMCLIVYGSVAKFGKVVPVTKENTNILNTVCRIQTKVLCYMASCFYERMCFCVCVHVYCVGVRTHDLFWLWPLLLFISKGSRLNRWLCICYRILLVKSEMSFFLWWSDLWFWL